MAKTPRKSVFVVRQEFLEYDLQDLEQFLAADGSSASPALPMQFHPNDSIHFVSGKISANLQNNQQRQKLCCSLFPEEWPFYVMLIQRAENLSQDQKVSTLQNAWKECGAEKHPADIEAMLGSYSSLRDWSQAFLGDVCHTFYADDVLSEKRLGGLAKLA